MRDTIVAPYNVVPTLDDSVAAVLVEPVAANMNLVAPRATGFLEGLRAECDRVGALLIFDEVITGFRLAYGGARGVLRRHARPLVLRQGHRRRAAGRRLRRLAPSCSRSLAPDGPVYQAGTLSGNPLATAAGAKVLERSRPRRLRGARQPRRAVRGRPCRTRSRRAGLFALAPTQGPCSASTCRASASGAAQLQRGEGAVRERALPSFFHAMLERGVALAPGAYEILFVSMAHSDDDLGARRRWRAHAAKVAATQ